MLKRELLNSFVSIIQEELNKQPLNLTIGQNWKEFWPENLQGKDDSED
jgi:hypothetical protein